MEEVWQRSEPAQFSREERRFTERCNMQPAFTVWWRNGKIVKNLTKNPGLKRSGPFVNKKVEAKTHRVEWCAAAKTYRCTRHCRNSKQMNMPGTCQGPAWLEQDSNHKLETWEQKALGRVRHGEESGPKWRGRGVVQRVPRGGRN